MISILVNKRARKKIQSIDIEGHGEGLYGFDVVCAGVSACFVGSLNALSKPKKFKIDMRSGFGKVEVIDSMKITRHDDEVLENLVIAFLTIQQSYPDKVKVTILPPEKEKVANTKKVSRKEGKK
ncbi:MAG: ribosomal-processing cysteine protease Prp [Bacilli bacterium]